MDDNNSRVETPGGLGLVERQALSALAALERPAATADDLVARVGLSRQRANLTLSRLARKGWLSRLRRGSYAITPLSAQSSQVVDDPLAVAMALFAPCYISGWTAAEHWGLTEQVSNVVVVYSAKHERRARQEAGGVSYRIRRIPSETIFGIVPVWSGTVRVQLANVHRTIIDILDAPEMGGGGRQTLDCARAYWRRPDADPEALLMLAEQLGRGSVFKRLGFVAERFGDVNTDWIRRCEHNLTSGIAQFDPGGAKPGQIVSRWRLRINIPLEDLA